MPMKRPGSGDLRLSIGLPGIRREGGGPAKSGPALRVHARTSRRSCAGHALPAEDELAIVSRLANIAAVDELAGAVLQASRR